MCELITQAITKKSYNEMELQDVFLTSSHPQCTVHHPGPGIHTAAGYLPLLLAPFRLAGGGGICLLMRYSHISLKDLLL